MNIKVSEAAKLMGKSEQFVRIHRNKNRHKKREYQGYQL